ncbi:MAG: hypothetical protein IEMM0003_0891 [bacterium]|nr:MAG: hypothetical protein IEMM0003_0891 [bacterium]
MKFIEVFYWVTVQWSHHLEPQIHLLCVANFDNSSAIICNLRLDETDLNSQFETLRINRVAL